MVMTELKDHQCSKCKVVGQYAGREATFGDAQVTWWIARCQACGFLDCFQFSSDGSKRDNGWKEAVVCIFKRFPLIGGG